MPVMGHGNISWHGRSGFIRPVMFIVTDSIFGGGGSFLRIVDSSRGVWVSQKFFSDFHERPLELQPRRCDLYVCLCL